jgi:peptidoglycan/xylan/chitin deacetylase (PgdA/CDA1 family)
MSLSPVKWPDGVKMAVSISFDVDGESCWLDGTDNGRRLTVLSMGAYGRRVGIYRILKLLKQHEIPAQFFVPGYIAEIDEELVRAIDQDGHPIGCHGYYHERTDTLSYEQEDEILARSKEILFRLTNKEPRGYRAPLWEITPQTLTLLNKHGFLYESSLMGTDVPYIVPAGDTRLLELPVTWLLDDWVQFGYSVVPQVGAMIEDPDKVLRLWKSEFQALYKEGRYFNLTMHPQLSGRASRMEMLSELIEFMKGYEGVWFCTPQDIYEAWNKGTVSGLQEFPY